MRDPGEHRTLGFKKRWSRAWFGRGGGGTGGGGVGWGGVGGARL